MDSLRLIIISGLSMILNPVSRRDASMLLKGGKKKQKTALQVFSCNQLSKALIFAAIYADTTAPPARGWLHRLRY